MSPIPVPEIDPKAIRISKEYKNHKKSTFWQIYFPLILTLVLFSGIVVLAILTTIDGDLNGTNSKWASLLLIIYISVASIFALTIGAALFYMASLLGKGIHATLTYTNMAKFYADLININIKKASDALVKPMIKTQATAKGAQTFFKSLRKVGKKNY